MEERINESQGARAIDLLFNCADTGDMEEIFDMAFSSKSPSEFVDRVQEFGRKRGCAGPMPDNFRIGFRYMWLGFYHINK